MTCDFTHARAYSWNKRITVSHPFSCVGYKTVIAVDISPRSLFIIAECVLQAYTVCRYVSQNDVTLSWRLRSGLTRQPDTPDASCAYGGSIWIAYYVSYLESVRFLLNGISQSPNKKIIQRQDNSHDE